MGSVIKMSEATYLGMHALALIALEEKRINVNTLAKKTGTSANHLSKVMQFLVREKYVKSVRGPKGGFTLIEDPQSITLLMIYELFEGKITKGKCPFKHSSCSLKKCMFGDVVKNVTDEFINYLKGTTLKDLI